MEQTKKKWGARNWLSLILIGLVGQLSWAIENNYINLWVYSQTYDTTYVTWMTITSALAATVTTLLMGALSDRLGKRKIFIAGGYIAWGLSVFLFGLISYRNMLNLVGAAMAVTMVGTFMVLADILMTFFGSTANDAAFNAYITDKTNSENRGKIEAVNSVLPLVGNIVIVLVAGIMGCAAYPTGETGLSLEENATALESNWFYFFLIFGIIILVMGVASFFLLPKEEIKPNKETAYFRQIAYGFRPSVAKENKSLYLALLSFMAYNCAIQSFMPYWMIYFQTDTSLGGAGIGTGIEYYLVVGSILVIASALTVVTGLFMDKIGRLKLILPALGLTVLGFLFIFFSGSAWSIALSGIVMMFGYLLSTAVLGAEIRDLTPQDRVGAFQGVRMVFVVLIPMIVGPLCAQATFSTNDSYVDSYGKTGGAVPNRYMFLVAMGFALLSVIPVLFLLRQRKAEKAASLVSIAATEEPEETLEK